MKTLYLDTSALHNVKDLHDALNELMGYPDWYNRNMDDWIDLISVFNRPSPLSPSLRSQKKEMFNIEITNANSQMAQKPQIINRLLAITTQVNQRYQEKIGHPVITLTLR